MNDDTEIYCLFCGAVVTAARSGVWSGFWVDADGSAICEAAGASAGVHAADPKRGDGR
jgi:hypothetical protein